MRIIVTGGRKYDDYERIYNALAEFKNQEDVTVVHGGASGADLDADLAAKMLGYDVEVHQAQWEKYGRAAGPKRNEEMCKSGANYCFAFPGGKGTANCVFLAKRHQIPVVKHA